VQDAIRQIIGSQRTLYGHKLNDIKAAFDAIDKDGSGAVNHREFRTAMHRLGLGLTDRQLTQLVGAIDPAQSDVISCESFTAWLAQCSDHPPQAEPPREKQTALTGTAAAVPPGEEEFVSHHARRFEALIREQMEAERVTAPRIPASSRRLAAAVRPAEKIWDREFAPSRDDTARWLANMSPIRRRNIEGLMREKVESERLESPRIPAGSRKLLLAGEAPVSFWERSSAIRCV
jgi:hypothetical protein